MPVYISENGFITLTLSAIETSIDYEASGLLLGYKVEDIYYVEGVVPYQIAERTAKSISVSTRRQKRLRRVFENYMKYKIIGEFHTHPEGSVKLSNSDKKLIRSSGYELEIVVVIEINRDQLSWHYEKGELSGSIDKFFTKIACWKITPNKIVKMTIRCPFAVGFDFSKPGFPKLKKE